MSSSSSEKRSLDNGDAPDAKRSKTLVLNEGTVEHSLRRILVTGGAGFIGSHLCEALLADEGNEVICVDNCFSGDKENIRHLLSNNRFEFLRWDVVEPLLLEVDDVYHLACPASPVFYQANPIKTLKTNFLGTLNALGLAKRCGARFLITSTSEVYGDPDVHPQPEEYWGNVNPIGPRSCYDEGKRVAETLCFEYARKHMPGKVHIARLFNCYGPRLARGDGRVVSNFIMQALRGQALTVYGDGKQTRSFAYVSDVVRGLIAHMNSDHMGPINIGNDGEYEVGQLATMIQKSINPDVDVVYKPLPSDDPKRRRPDLTKARTLLGYEITVPLKEGLEATIAYFRALHEKDLARKAAAAESA